MKISLLKNCMKAVLRVMKTLKNQKQVYQLPIEFSSMSGFVINGKIYPIPKAELDDIMALSSDAILDIVVESI